MSKPVVLIAEQLSPATVDALGPEFEIRDVDGTDRPALLSAIADAEAILVRSAIELAHNLGLFVTAEGVEDLTALAILDELGCDQVQGFALAYPVPADELMAEIRKAQDTARATLKPPTRRGAATVQTQTAAALNP